MFNWDGFQIEFKNVKSENNTSKLIKKKKKDQSSELNKYFMILNLDSLIQTEQLFDNIVHWNNFYKFLNLLIVAVIGKEIMTFHRFP